MVPAFYEIFRYASSLKLRNILWLYAFIP